MLLTSLSQMQYSLVVFAIVSGSLIFYMRREEIESIEAEHEAELAAEQVRAREFTERFPRFSRVPVFGWMGKWGYKEGLYYSMLLIIVTFSFLGF